MDPVVTLDGITLHPLAADGTGYGVDGDKFTGWYGAPATRASYTDRPSAMGSYYAPAYTDKRVIAIGGKAFAADRAGLLGMQRRLSGICRDPYRLYELRVVDEFGSLACMVQRSADVLFDRISDRQAAYSLQLTAPDPRLLDTRVQSVSTPMAQSSVTGVQFRGPDGTSGAQFRGPDGTTGLPWGKPGPSGVVTLDNREGTAPADIVLTIKGPVTNPSVSTSTDWITYNGSLSESDVLVINTGSGSVQFNGSNRRTLLSRADFFLVPAGEALQVRFTAEVQSPTAELTAAFQRSYI